MKLGGETLSVRNERIFPIVRDNKTIYLRIKAVEDLDDFHKMCPLPTPPTIQKPGKEAVPNLKHPAYQAALWDRHLKLTAYLVVEGLEGVDLPLVWDTVVRGDIDTYTNYVSELKNAGLSYGEIAQLVDSVNFVNGLTEEAIEKARESFLAGEHRAVVNESGPKDDLENIPSGEPVSVGESALLESNMSGTT